LGPQQTMTWMGGEVKSPKKTLLYGMIGAWAVSGILWLTMFALLDSSVGTRFVEAMNFLSVNSPNVYAQTGMPAGVNPSLISILLLTRNPWLMLIITLGVFVGNMGWIIITVPVTARVLFAWSFDRLAPTKFAHVSDRYGTPTNAIALVVAGSILLYIILLINPTVFVVNGSVLTAITYAIVGIAAAAFAYTRKDIFERSPLKTRIAGIPILSILGVVMVVVYGYMAYESLSNPNIGNLSTPALLTAVGFLVLAPILFYLSVAVRKRQGIDLKMVFKEIPPE
jgi:APA family basic amino acid/polyamine antiporter